MSVLSMSFKSLNRLPLLAAVLAMTLASCASRPSSEPLPEGFRDFLARWEKESTLCSIPPEKIKGMVKETASGPQVDYPIRVVRLLETVKWKKENTLRSEARGFFEKLPVNVSDADYGLLLRAGCNSYPSYAAVTALLRAETGNTRRAPSKRSMKVIGEYVSVGPNLSSTELMLQWTVLRDLSISNYYLRRVPKTVLAEMDGFSAELQQRRIEMSDLSDPSNNYEAYSRFREDVRAAWALRVRYDSILRKLRPIMFR